VGFCAIAWAIWKYQNDVVFNKTIVPKKIASYLQSYSLNVRVVISPSTD
jgi:hypothetical protein